MWFGSSDLGLYFFPRRLCHEHFQTTSLGLSNFTAYYDQPKHLSVSENAFSLTFSPQ